MKYPSTHIFKFCDMATTALLAKYQLWILFFIISSTVLIAIVGNKNNIYPCGFGGTLNMRKNINSAII